MPIAPGDKLGPYEILSPIGAGGMGEVYKARDTRLERSVAVKVLPEHIAKREDLRGRFEREARAVASLNHPNICTLFDIGQQDGASYMVMELMEGETLAARIAKGPIPLLRLHNRNRRPSVERTPIDALLGGVIMAHCKLPELKQDGPNCCFELLGLVHSPAMASDFW